MRTRCTAVAVLLFLTSGDESPASFSAGGLAGTSRRTGRAVASAVVAFAHWVGSRDVLARLATVLGGASRGPGHWCVADWYGGYRSLAANLMAHCLAVYDSGGGVVCRSAPTVVGGGSMAEPTNFEGLIGVWRVGQPG